MLLSRDSIAWRDATESARLSSHDQKLAGVIVVHVSPSGNHSDMTSTSYYCIVGIKGKLQSLCVFFAPMDHPESIVYLNSVRFAVLSSKKKQYHRLNFYFGGGLDFKFMKIPNTICCALVMRTKIELISR